MRLDDISRRLPDLVFVLAALPEGGQSGGIELRRTPRQELTAVGYTSIDRLVAACGSGQPWVHVTRRQLEDLCREAGIAIVAVDVVVDVAPRYPELDSREQPPLEQLDELDEPDGYLYVPSRPVHEGQYHVELELQPNNAGRPLMLAYTSPELLTAGCGEFQPWVAIHADDMPGAIEESGAHGVLLNPVLAEQSRHTGPIHDWDTHSIVGWS